MAIRLSREADAGIRGHGRRDYPHECCGALLGEVVEGRKVVRALRPLRNVHEEGHERRFRIDPLELLAVEREARAAGQKVLGFYHSHPDHPARPSAYDREWAWPWYSYIILAVARGEPGEMTSWIIEDEGEPFTQEKIEGE